jgi:4'-phosphopantetheinyl transferase
MALPADDQAWVDASVDAIVARRRRSGRTALRQLLGSYLDRAPATLVFERNAHGKPRLAGDGPAFNLSHSDDLMLFAVAEQGELGVDVDRLDRLAGDWRGVARVALSPDEQAALAGLAEADRAAATMRVWIRKEAYTKGLGTGFARRFETVAVGFDDRPVPARVDDRAVHRADWLVGDLPAPAPWAAAIACRDGGARITYWQYSS